MSPKMSLSAQNHPFGPRQYTVHARSARALHRSVVGGTAKQDDKPSRRFCQLRQRERLSLEAGQLLNAGKLFYKDTSEAGFEAPTEGEAGFEAGFEADEPADTAEGAAEW